MDERPYQERLVEEYHELQERINKLGSFIIKLQNNEFDGVLTCPIEVLQAQYDAMWSYKSVLKLRFRFEGIEI